MKMEISKSWYDDEKWLRKSFQRAFYRDARICLKWWQMLIYPDSMSFLDLKYTFGSIAMSEKSELHRKELQKHQGKPLIYDDLHRVQWNLYCLVQIWVSRAYNACLKEKDWIRLRIWFKIRTEYELNQPQLSLMQYTFCLKACLSTSSHPDHVAS